MVYIPRVPLSFLPCIEQLVVDDHAPTYLTSPFALFGGWAASQETIVKLSLPTLRLQQSVWPWSALARV